MQEPEYTPEVVEDVKAVLLEAYAMGWTNCDHGTQRGPSVLGDMAKKILNIVSNTQAKEVQ